MSARTEADPPSIQAVHLLTIGSFPRPIAEGLAARVSRRVSVPCRLLDGSLAIELPFLPSREQVDADRMIEILEAREIEPRTVLVGLTEQDLGSIVFTFVFGKARQNGHAALVSLARLKPEAYGMAPDPETTTRRAVAEILHEMGHTGGLGHCKDVGCLMHFAHNVESIDLRGSSFCADCTESLPRGLRLLGPSRSG